MISIAIIIGNIILLKIIADAVLLPLPLAFHKLSIKLPILLGEPALHLPQGSGAARNS